MISQYQYPTLNPTFDEWNASNPVGPYDATTPFRDPYLSEGNSAQWDEALLSQNRQRRFQALPDWEQAYLRQPLSNDQYALLLNKKVGDQARQVRLRADIQNQLQNSALLSAVGQASPLRQQIGPYPMQQTTFSPFQSTLAGRGQIDPNQTAQEQMMQLRQQSPALSSIYSAPTTPDEARLQAILNRDYQGRELGSKLSMEGIAYNAALRRKLARENLDDQIKWGQYQLKKKSDEEDIAGKALQLRTLAANNLNTYRNARLGQIDQGQTDRANAQDASLAFKQGQAGIKNKRADAYLSRFNFGDWVNSAKSGVPLEDLNTSLQTMWPGLTPQQQDIAKSYISQRNQDQTQAEASATQWNDALKNSLPQPYTKPGGLFSKAMIVPPDPEEINAAVQSVISKAMKDPRAKKYLSYDPQTQTFIPIAQNQSSPESGGFSTAMAAASNASLPISSADMLQAGIDEGYGQPSAPPQFNPMDQIYGPPRPAAVAASPATSNVIAVPPEIRGRYAEGRVYLINGTRYRFINGQMVR